MSEQEPTKNKIPIEGVQIKNKIADRFTELKQSSKYLIRQELNKYKANHVLKLTGGVIGDVVGMNDTMRTYVCFRKNGDVMYSDYDSCGDELCRPSGMIGWASVVHNGERKMKCLSNAVRRMWKDFLALGLWRGLLPLGLPILLFASKRLRGVFSSLARSCSRWR